MEMIVVAEQRVRDSAVYRREWLIRKKEELREEERKRQVEEERRRQERQAQLERARVDHLLEQANALRQATEIRAYGAAVRNANEEAPYRMCEADLESWAGWALAQADRIDPVLSGSYKTRPLEPDE